MATIFLLAGGSNRSSSFAAEERAADLRHLSVLKPVEDLCRVREVARDPRDVLGPFFWKAPEPTAEQNFGRPVSGT
jgi:hypothetical protein